MNWSFFCSPDKAQKLEKDRGKIAAARAGMGATMVSSSSVFSTLTMPNGHRIQTMREDAFRAALDASRKAAR